MVLHTGQFNFDGPFKSVVGAVARASVIRPLYGPYNGYAELNEQYTRLVEKWRSRICSLRGYDIPMSSSRYASCIGCMPSGVVCRPSSYVCRCEYLCPFCWGRMAQRMFRALRGLFACLKGPYSSDYWLIAYRAVDKVHYGRSTALRKLRELFSSYARKRNTIRYRLNASAAYFCLSLEPARDADNWRFTQRGLIVTGADVPSQEIDAHYGGSCVVKSVNAPNRLHLAKLVPWTMRYPVNLMHGDPERVATVIRARKGIRMSASYGCLRSYEHKLETESNDVQTLPKAQQG